MSSQSETIVASLTGLASKVASWFGSLELPWNRPSPDPTLVPVPEALAELQAESPRARWQAAAALGQHERLDGAALKALVAALGDNEPFVRWSATEALAGQKRDRLLRLLGPQLDAPEPVRRSAAVEIIGRLGAGDEALRDRVTGLLADAEPSVRAAALQAAGALGLAGARPQILGLLQDPDVHVRRQAAGALGKLFAGEGGAGLALLDRLLDPSEHVLCRRAAAAALVRVAPPGMPDTLPAALVDPDPQVRAYIARLMGEVGDPNAGEALAALLGDESEVIGGRVCEVAGAALVRLDERQRAADLSASGTASDTMAEEPAGDSMTGA